VGIERLGAHSISRLAASFASQTGPGSNRPVNANAASASAPLAPATVHHLRDACQSAGPARRAADQRTAGGARQQAAPQGVAAPRRQQQQETRAEHGKVLARKARAPCVLLLDSFDPGSNGHLKLLSAYELSS
jgi:hypothetical protein